MQFRIKWRAFYFLTLLSWRNVVRNKRRALFTLSAIIIAVTSSNFFAALQRGMSNQLIESAISSITGNIQIHNTKFLNDPSLENRLQPLAKDQIEFLDNQFTGIWTQRLRVPAVLMSERDSASVTLIGSEPEKERKAGYLPQNIEIGRALDDIDDSGLIIGRSLAEELQTSINKRLVLMSVSSDGNLVERGFRIVGIYKSLLDAEERSYVFSGRQVIAQFLQAPGQVSEITLRFNANESDSYPLLERRLKELFPNEDVRNWRELQPLVDAIVKVQDGVLWVWYIIVMVTVAFGLVNTLFMAIFERIREIGLYRALGMRKAGVISSVLLESFFLLSFGILLGDILSLLIVTYLSSGIDLSQFAKGTAVIGLSKVVYPSLRFSDAGNINILVLFIGLISSLYPAWRAGSLEPAVGLSRS